MESSTSSSARIFSGSVASGLRIGVGLFSQIVLLPVFLASWEPALYGHWIGVFALATAMQFIDMGHHNYIGFEALRMGEHRRDEIGRLYTSAVRIAAGVGAIEFLLVCVFVLTGTHMRVLGSGITGTTRPGFDAGVLLILLSASWVCLANCSSIAGRVLVPFGYFHRIAWWQVAGAIVAAVAPAAAVLFGAHLLGAAIAYHIAYGAYALAVVIWINRMVRREGLAQCRPDYMYGVVNFWRSLALSFKGVMDMFRNEQLRIVIAPLLGPANLVVFATTRTLANLLNAVQSALSTPVAPELLRYLNVRDAQRAIALMTLMWIAAAGVLGPSAVAGQLFLAPLFTGWTQGKVAWDPALFAILAATVLVASFGQPAMAVVQGRNLVRPQVSMSLAASAIAVVGTILFSGPWGLRAAAASLLCGELVVAVWSLSVMRHSLEEMGLPWPRTQTIAAGVGLVATLAIQALASVSALAPNLLLASALGCAAATSGCLFATIAGSRRLAPRSWSTQ